MIPTLVCYLFSLIFLFIRLKTKKKRDFIISVFMILIGTILGRIEYEFSVLNYFLIAILLSFFGDMLMAEYIKITNFRTIDGVMMFGLAHIMYIISFYQFNIGGYNLEFSLEGLYDFLITILCIFTAYILYNKVGSSEKMNDAIKFANLCYTIVVTILFILVLSFVITSTTPTLMRFTSLFGILLFIISDSLLSYNEFINNFKNAKDWIAITYVLSQILLQITPLLWIA